MSSSSKRSFSTPPSAAVVVGNDDLLIEILLFLHAKSLVGFKLVSKRWCSLISAPSFCFLHTVNHHLRRPEIQPLFILGSEKSDKYLVYNATLPRSLPFSFPSGLSKVLILQSCNGLLLLRCGKAEEGDSHSYHVFNPTTMQQRDLSPLPSSSTVSAIYLLFDPSLSPHYKVVYFACAKKCTLVYVYDSETHNWKTGGELNKTATSFRKGIYFNGGIYFVRFGSSSSRFDPFDNNVSMIPKPPRHRSVELANMNRAMESNGVMLSLTLSWDEDNCLLDVWEMNENENRWINKYRADMQPKLDEYGTDMNYPIHLLGIIEGEKELDSLLLLSLDEKMMIYKFHDNVFVEDDSFSQQFRNGRPLWRLKAHHFFIQSLAPV